MKGGALVLLQLLLLAGCQRTREELAAAFDGPAVQASAVSAVSSAVDAASTPGAPISPAVSSALVAIRNTQLTIAPPRAPRQRLAFGKGMLGELGADRLLVRSTTKPDRLTRIDVPGARALLALPSGALLAAGSEAVYRLDPGAKKARVFKRVVFFPDSELLPERADDGFFWVAHRSPRSAQKYELEASELPVLLTQVEATLEAFDGRAITMSRDGVFVYSTDSGIARLVPRGKLTRFARPSGSSGRPIWRLLPAERLDQIWVIAEDGEVELWPLWPNAPVVRRFRLAVPPYEVAAGQRVLAALGLEQGGGKPRRFWLLVHDQQGVERFRSELPADPATSGDDWLADVTRNKNVALSEAENQVAVGGPGWLGVWNLETGARLDVR